MAAVQRITTNRRSFNNISRIAEVKSDVTAAIPGFRQIRAAEMQVDHGYQRLLSPSHSAAIARDFDPLLFGVILLAQRTDGTYWILDGQQRVGAIRLLGADSDPIPCEVLTGLSWSDEARIYDLRNKNRKSLTPQEKFKGALAWGDETAINVQRTVRTCGYRVNLDDSYRTDGRIPAVSALTGVVRQYRDGHLAETLTLIRKTWGIETGPRDLMLKGLAYFLHLYRGRVSVARFAEALGKYTMEQIHAEGREYKRATGTTGEVAFCEVVVQHYNARLRDDNRLPAVAEMRVLNRIGEATNGK